MTRKEFQTILKVLEHIKNPNAYVREAILLVQRDIERYNKTKGQLLERWEYDERESW